MVRSSNHSTISGNYAKPVSDIDTETAATLVPAAALSGRDAALGVKLTPVGMALTWTGIEPETVTLF